jgi:hypothetical protein
MEDSGHNSFPGVEYPIGHVPDPLRVPVMALKAPVLLCQLLPLTTHEKKKEETAASTRRSGDYRVSRSRRLPRSLESWSCRLEVAGGTLR